MHSGFGTIIGSNISSPLVWMYNATNNAFDVRSVGFNQDPSAGTSLFVVRSSGNIGIGTTNPQQKLDIEGSGATGAIRIAKTDATTNNWDLGYLTGSINLLLRPTTDALFAIKDAGNSLNALLVDTVTGNTTIGGNLILNSSSATTTFGGIAYTWPTSGQSNGYVLQTNGSGTLSWTASGGLGTNYWQENSGALSPKNITDDLLLGGTATSSATFGLLNVAGGTPTATISSNLSLKVPTGNSPAEKINILNGGNLGFYTSVGGDTGLSGNPALYVANGGYVGVGSTGTSGYKLAVNGSELVNAGTLLVNNNAGSSANDLQIQHTGAVSTSNLQYNFSERSNNTDLILYTYDGTNFWDPIKLLGASKFLSLMSDGGTLSVGTTTPLDQTGLYISKNAANEALLVNQAGGGPIFTASQGGSLKFSIDNSGNTTNAGNLAVNGGSITTTQTTANLFNATPTTINFGGNATALNIGASTGSTTINNNLVLNSATATTTFGGIAYTWPTSGQSNGYVLQTNGSGTLSWVSNGGTSNYWQLNSGALSPATISNDLLLGGTATSSATFGFINIANGTPTATISSNLSLKVPTGSNPAATLNMINGGSLNFQTATTGQGDSGLASRLFINNNGNIGIGTTAPAALVDVSSGTAGKINFTKTGTNAGVAQIYNDGNLHIKGISGGNISTWYNSDVQVFTNQAQSTEYMRITSGGSVAIGNTTPGNDTLVVNQQNSSGDIFSASQGAATKFVISNAGNVGIGTNAPGYALDLQSSTAATAAAEIYNTNNGANADGLALKLGFTGNGTVPTTQTTGNSFERYLNGNGVAQGSIDSNGLGGVTYNTNGIDFAEYFTKAPNTSFAEGDVVSLGGTDGQMATKSTTGYDPKLLGIVSAHPGYVGGTPGDNKVLVGLTGQLPVKVSTENGAIQAGDMLTSSNTLPGVAMKATKPGEIIAKALESYSGTGVGTIEVYVSATYADPNVQITDSGDLSVNGQAPGTPTPTTNALVTSNTPANTISTDQFNGLSNTVATMQSQIASMSSQLSKVDDLSKQLADLQTQTNLLQTLQGISTQSAVLGAATTSGDTTIGGTLSVTGRTLLADVGITGSVTDGLLTINGMDTSTATPAATINSLSAPLKIQSLATAGVDFENGNLTIDTNGNLVTQGDITAKTVHADQGEFGKLSIKNSTTATDSASIGEATIPAGKTSVEIKTSAITDTSKIFATPRKLPIPVSTDITEKQTFEIDISKPLQKDLQIDWWVLN